jgi:Lrp/AsnC family leucine-responsive transcriptional regulator
VFTVSDPTDLQIIKELNHNCRIKVTQLAQLVHLTPPAVAARIQRLEDAGIIKRYTIEVDLEKMGFMRQVFIQVAVAAQQQSAYRELIQAYRQDIRHHYQTTGDFTHLIEGAFPDQHRLSQFLQALSMVATYRVIDAIDELF